jgi:hypothetical protein
MSPWLKVQSDLPYHPKTTRLARSLKIERAPAVGILICLWAWAFHYAEDGKLRKYSDQELAEAAYWNGDPKALVKALKSAGWLDSDRSIHDWNEHSGAYIKERERWRKSKQKPLQIPTNNEGIPESTLGNPALRVDKIRKIKSIVPSATSLLTPDFVAWWETYGKVGSRADAAVLYGYWRQHGAQTEDLVAAATNYRTDCLSRSSYQAHGRTFLAKTPNRWQEWVKPEAKPNGNGNGKKPCVDCLVDLTYDEEGLMHCPICGKVPA